MIGASTRAGSFGERVVVNLQHYGGRVYPVNARYERIGEQRCYPNVAALPEVPDCAVVTAPREAVEEIVEECAAAGVGGVIVFASGYAETGKEDRIAQQHRLAAIAREQRHAHRRAELHRRGERAARHARDVHGHHADPGAAQAVDRHGQPVRRARAWRWRRRWCAACRSATC